MMFTNLKNWLLAGLTSCLLAACGGGSENAGTPILGGGGSNGGSASNPALTVSISSTTLSVSGGSATLSATARDGAGQPLVNQVVRFSSATGAVKLSAASALTNASGVASVTATPADASVDAAEELVASVTINGTEVTAKVAVQLVADKPTLAVALSNSTITATSPATVRAVVKDTRGQPVAGALVSFSSAFGLGAFDAQNAISDAAGVASVVLSSASAASNGADLVRVETSIGGVVLTAQASAQFTASSGSSGNPVLQMALSSSSISSATPATVTATLTDSKGQPVAGQVVTFSVVRRLAATNVGTALTDAAGKAVVVLSPTSSTAAGADEVNAAASYAGASLQVTQGFQVQATNVTLTSFASAVSSLGAYAQTFLTVNLSGASVGAPVNVSVTSSCVAQGKATLSPSSFIATTASVVLQYKDAGCGAVQTADQLQATIVGSASAQSLSLPIAAPTAGSLAFIQSQPETIYLKGSGFTETSTVTFELRDGAGNTLPNRDVVLKLLTLSGGVTMDGGTVDVARATDAAGRVSVRINSGTVPTPVRIQASLAGASISTVSSNLSVAVGLPSQLNFSMSQQTINIEGYNIDGTPNVYSIIAADRSGNPVPAGTSINFVTEGGQVEAIRQTGMVNGLARASANFVSSEPRPLDGRVTVTSYALGEETFIDQNGNNTWDPAEPFLDLGNVIKDRIYDGAWDPVVDEFVPLLVNNSSACVAPGNSLLGLNPSIPTMPGTCDGTWSGPDKVYVRRAVETVLSTSSARALWANTRGLDSSCQKITLQNGPLPTMTGSYTLLTGDTWHAGGTSGSLSFLAADANPIRLNPMPAGTTITASTSTKDLKVEAFGGPVPSTSEVSGASVAFDFGPESPSEGVITVAFRSPSGLVTAYSVRVRKNSIAPTACP